MMVHNVGTNNDLYSEPVSDNELYSVEAIGESLIQSHALPEAQWKSICIAQPLRLRIFINFGFSLWQKCRLANYIDCRSCVGLEPLSHHLFLRASRRTLDEIVCRGQCENDAIVGSIPFFSELGRILIGFSSLCLVLFQWYLTLEASALSSPSSSIFFRSVPSLVVTRPLFFIGVAPSLIWEVSCFLLGVIVSRLLSQSFHLVLPLGDLPLLRGHREVSRFDRRLLHAYCTVVLFTCTRLLSGRNCSYV